MLQRIVLDTNVFIAAQMRWGRGKQIAMVLQDPMTSWPSPCRLKTA